jgi:nondiscriminating glutamyl-tRNA synthetase
MMVNREMRLRFAPSPTGPIHVGNVHTMLFNWLWCRSQGAIFVLRFEDTDRERSKQEWEEVIMSEMQWLGLDWDEGPDIGGPFAPYYQTARMHLYQEYFEMLKQRGAVYPCYCTPEELAEERQQADHHKIAYQYSRRCLALTSEERLAKEGEGRQPVWRLLVPRNEVVAYDDLIRGRIAFDTNTIGDPVIMRANGIPLYNFAVVVDDITMSITDVVRGEGHISNTPVQVLIYRQLAVPLPRFAHCSHLLNAQRGKISKRNGEMSVRSFRERGVLAEVLFNYLALLGWTPKGEGREVLTREEIIREFSIFDVSRSAAIFDEVKLLKAHPGRRGLAQRTDQGGDRTLLGNGTGHVSRLVLAT